MSGKRSRDKGARSERNIVNILKDNGVPAKRISPLETNGVDKGDIELGGIWRGEVKSGSHVPKFIYNARKTDEQFLFMRRDREKWLVCMDLDFFLETFITGPSEEE